MSNFMFPVCKNINCGNKKEREIEIEKKLDIAIKALKEIRNEAEAATWSVNAKWLIGTVNGVFFDIERI